MNQMTTFILIMTGSVVVMFMFGIIDPTHSINASLLTFITNPTAANATNTLTSIFVSLNGIVLAGGIIIGFFTKNYDWFVMTPIGILLFNLLWDFWQIFVALKSVFPPLAVLVISPLLVLWIFTTVEYIRGRD